MILARWMKPFSDGDFIKECHVAVVDSVCPEQRSVFESVSLSSRTVRRRIEEMSQLACVPDDVEPDTCVSVVASMREEVASRFAGIKPLAAYFKLFTAPFDFPVDDAPAPLPMELVELQCNYELKAKFYNSSPLSFFRDIALPSRNFPTFIAHVQRVVAMFGGTVYCCEQSFSKMKYTKSRLRSLLTFCSCQAHPSSRTLISFSMASSTSHLTDLPDLQ